MVVDSEGTEVRRIVSERRLAGDAKHRFRWDGRDDDGNPGARRDLPDARRAARREPGDRLREGDHGGPQATEGDAAVGGAVGGRHRAAGRDAAASGCATAGRRTRRPWSACFAPDDGKPHIVRRFRGGPNRGAVWDGQVSAGPERTGPGAGGRLRLHGRRTRPRGERDRGAAPGAARGGGAAGHGRVGAHASPCAARCPPSRRAPTRTSRSGRWTAASTGWCRGSATPRPSSTAAAWPAASASGSRARRGPASTWCACASGDDRAVWPLAVAGLPPRSARSRARPLVVLPALTWQGLNRVDDDADGFGDRLPFATVRPARPPVRRRRPAEALRRRGLAAAALARPRAARLRPHHRPRAGPARGSRARERPGRGVRRAASCGLPRRADGAPARLRGGRWRAWPCSVPTRSSARSICAATPRRNPSPPRRANALRRADRAAAHEQGAAHGVRGRPRAVRGPVELRGRVHACSRSPATSRAAPAGSRPRAATPAEPAFLALGLGGGIVLRAGTPQWARELEESALSLELPIVTKRIWRMLSAGGST